MWKHISGFAGGFGVVLAMLMLAQRLSGFESKGLSLILVRAATTLSVLLVIALIWDIVRWWRKRDHQQKPQHDAPVAAPTKPDAGRQATATGASTAIGSTGNLRAGRDIFIGVNKPTVDAGTPEHPIDVSLTCTGVFILPLEIKVGRVVYVLPLNPTAVRRKSFYRIDNTSGDASVLWPNRQLLNGTGTPICGSRCDIKNHSNVNLARITLDIQLIYGKTFPPNSLYQGSIEINHLDHGEEFSFYLFNPCPNYVSLRFSNTAKARLAGRTEMREFPLVQQENTSYGFQPSSANFMQMSCE